MISEINDLSQPTILEQYIGQERVKALIQTALESCWMDGICFPDALALGSPGLGKTQMFKLIALEMATNCREILASSISNISDLHSLLINCKEHDIVFFDEIHTLKRELMVVLYRAMENRKIYVKSNDRKHPFCIDLPTISIAGATTDSHSLPKPMLDRYKLILNFEFYTIKEIEQILRNRCKKLHWTCHDEVYPNISSRSRGVPRMALRILENTRRVCRADGSDTIEFRHLQKALSLLSIDSMGLNSEERQYLHILSKHNGHMRLGAIAMSMGTLPRNLSQTIEPDLFRTGLVSKDDKGRILTPKGLEHIRANPISQIEA